MGGAGRSERSVCIDGHHLGAKTWPLYGVEGWPQIRGFLSTILYGDAVGTKVSGRFRQGGRSSGVAVKKGSTVYACLATLCVQISLHSLSTIFASE